MSKTEYSNYSEVADNQSSAMSDGVRFCGNERGTFTNKRLTNSGRNKGLFFGTCATLFVAVVSVLLFYGCKKDILNNGNSKNPQAMMSMGNHSQPTQNIDIHTYFGAGTTGSAVTGNAVVGSYNGLIYSCNLNWTMAVGTYTGYEMNFEAVLKPGLDGTAVGLTNGMQNYDITINGQPITETSGYTFEVDGDVFTIDHEAILGMWNRVVGFCVENVTIVTNPILEQKIIEAHNLMVDFVLRSKRALDNNPEAFEAVCAAGDMQGLMNMVFTPYEATQWRSQFTALVYEISAAYPIEGQQTGGGTGYCSSCALESFPNALQNMNYTALPGGGGNGGDAGWKDLALCLGECAASCGFCCVLAYPECVVACTALCYLLNSSKVRLVAPYSYAEQAYLEPCIMIY